MRLDLAIAEVTRARDLMDQAPGLPSVYAVLRQQHPTLQPHRLKKATLLALSWAIEDECCARAARPIIFGSFQKARYFRAAQDRWTELARIARSSVAFAAFEDAPEPVERTTLVHLPKDAPMRREWVVVCDAVDFPAVVTAWELPGQTGVSDRQRVFETIWTVHPRAVRDATRTCAQVALQLGTPEAASLLYELATTPDDPPTELDRVSSLLNRVVGYVDDLASPGSRAAVRAVAVRSTCQGRAPTSVRNAVTVSTESGSGGRQASRRTASGASRFSCGRSCSAASA